LTYQVHPDMENIWSGLADQVVRGHVLIVVPVVLDLQLSEPLGPGQCGLELVDTAIEVVLRFVEDLLGLEDLQDPLLPLQHLLGEQEIRQLVDGQVRLVPLCLQQVGARGGGRRQGLHPVWSRRHLSSGYGEMGIWGKREHQQKTREEGEEDK
jgi:hypothetical protein